MNISGRAKLAGVVGDPVAHSLSPQLHAHWLDVHRIDGAYVPLAVARESFAAVIVGLRKAGFAGINVTVPHKEAAFALAQRHDAAALATGAVNLLLFRDGMIEGRNTDAWGLGASLAEGLGRVGLKGRKAAVLGAGGAARAAVLALGNLGASTIRLVARNPARGEAVARELKSSVPCVIEFVSWNDWAKGAADIALLINATSAGMSGKGAPELELDPLPRDATVCDLVYNPLETTLLTAARARGHRVVDGLGMLMHQAVPAFEAFFGIRPAVTQALRNELEGALRAAH